MAAIAELMDEKDPITMRKKEVEYDIERIVAKYGSRQWSHPMHYNRMKNWLKIRVRRFGNVQIQSQEINTLKNELQDVKEQLKKKDAIIMEQIKVIMDLSKRIK